ncbi:MAG: hypothetical protein ABR863_10270 [Roseiarcus sp.]|jgi:hypothetical protein
MRASLKNSTSLSLAALACAVLLLAAPFDAAMARGNGTAGGAGAAAGAASGAGSGGPTVKAFDAVRYNPAPPTLVNADQTTHSPGCYSRADRLGLTGAGRIEFLKTCRL